MDDSLDSGCVGSDVVFVGDAASFVEGAAVGVAVVRGKSADDDDRLDSIFAGGVTDSACLTDV